MRLSADDGSPRFTDRHAGAIRLASGLYATLGNRGSQEVVEELTEQEALERLAEFRVLALMVDAASVAVAP